MLASKCFFIHLFLLHVFGYCLHMTNLVSISLPASKAQENPLEPKDFYKLLKGWLSTMLQWFLTITIFLLVPFSNNFFCRLFCRYYYLAAGPASSLDQIVDALKFWKEIQLQYSMHTHTHTINEVN